MKERICNACGSREFQRINGFTTCKFCGAQYDDRDCLVNVSKNTIINLSNRGFESIITNDVESARSTFNKILEIDNNSFVGYWGMLLVECIKGDNDKTIRYYMKKSLEESETNGDYENNLIIKYGEYPHLKFGITLMIYAVIEDEIKFLSFLLENHVNPNIIQSSAKKASALYYAANPKKVTEEKQTILRLLLNHEADPNKNTYNGEGVVNSHTPKVMADIIKEYYPDIICVDGKAQNNKSSLPKANTQYNNSSGVKQTVISKSTNKQTYTNRNLNANNHKQKHTGGSKKEPSPEDVKVGAVLLIILAIVFIIQIVVEIYTGALHSERDNSSKETSYSTYEHIPCKNYYQCENYTYYTQWNRGYCIECHKGTHKCAYEGCDVQISDHTKFVYCSRHDPDNN